jgi:Secretion system C-terminal sorting domain
MKCMKLSITRIAGFILFVLLTGCKLNTKKIFVPESDGMDKAMAYEFKVTRDPKLNIVPRERLIAARSYMKSMMSNSANNARTTALAWQERGPNNVGGRTRAIMIDKRDATGNTLFAGSVGGGIFKTTNFQSASPTWSPLNDQMANLAITALVQDRVNMNIMYAGTGEGWFNVDALKGAGVFKSTDGGTTWAQIPSTSTFEFIQDMLIDNGGNLYVSMRNASSANRGVRRSTDGGTTWTQVLGAPLAGFATGRATDLELAANGDIYAALGIFGRTIIMKSSFAANGAGTGALNNWVDITPFRTTITQRTEIALAPSDANRVYLVMQDSASSGNEIVSAIYRSNNGGNTWDSMPAPSSLNNGANSQTWYNLIAAVDPANADVLVAGGLNLAKSTDGSATWTAITTNSSVHVDHHALIYDGSSKLIDGNDGGIYASDNINAAIPTFTKKSNNYNVTQYYACDYHPTDANYFLAGAQDNGTQRFTVPGINTTTNASGGDGGFCHIDQTDGQIQITAFTSNQYAISVNSGTNFGSRNFNQNGQFINPTDYDDNLNLLYTGDITGNFGIVRNLTSAASATYGATAIPEMGDREVLAIKVDPNSANTIWLGNTWNFDQTTTAVPSQIIKLSNASSGAPTVLVNSTIPAPNGASISSIDVEQGNSNHVLVTLSNYGVVSVWESIDGGVSWTSIEGNLPDMPIRWGIFAPAGAQLNGATGGNGGIILATELGIWTTSAVTGATTTWIPNNAGFPNVSTFMVKLRPVDNTLVAATHGRGLFTTQVTTVSTGIPGPGVVTKDFIRYISSDNGNLQIVKGNLTATRTMDIAVYDVTGKLLLRQNNRYENTNLNIAKLSRGSYILKITGDKKENYVKHFVR